MSTHRTLLQSNENTQETSDGFSGVIAHLCDSHRVITCRDNHQWITQYRKKRWRRATLAGRRVLSDPCGSDPSVRHPVWPD